MSDEPSVRLVLGTGVVEVLADLAGQLEGVHADVLEDLHVDEQATGGDEAPTPGDAHPGPSDAVTLAPDAALGDRIWQRLYPRASEDDDTDRELRRLLQVDLAEERRRELAALVDVLTDRASPRDDGTVAVELDDEQAGMVLRTTHALMVALAVRVQPDIFVDPDQHLPRPRGPRGAALAEVIDLLQGLQEFVIAQLDPGARSHYERHDPAAGDVGPDGDEDHDDHGEG